MSKHLNPVFGLFKNKIYHSQKSITVAAATTSTSSIDSPVFKCRYCSLIFLALTKFIISSQIPKSYISRMALMCLFNSAQEQANSLKAAAKAATVKIQTQKEGGCRSTRKLRKIQVFSIDLK